MSPLTEPTKLTLAKGQPVPVDLNYSNVSLLLHGNGANGSTAIVDSSPTPKTVTAVGNAQISTAQSKFGGSSITFDGIGDGLSIPTHVDFEFGTGDFTIEFYAFRISTNLFGYIDWRLAAATSTLHPVIYGIGSSIIYFVAEVDLISGTIAANVFSHVAVSRSSGLTRMFINGAQVGSTIADSRSYIAPGQVLRVGQLAGGSSLSGYIDELRITKGVARYTSNFTPPTAPFPDF